MNILDTLLCQSACNQIIFSYICFITHLVINAYKRIYAKLISWEEQNVVAGAQRFVMLMWNNYSLWGVAGAWGGMANVGERRPRTYGMSWAGNNA